MPNITEVKKAQVTWWISFRIQDSLVYFPFGVLIK